MAGSKGIDTDFHHYVPKFFLRKFAYRSKKKAHYINVYDKKSDKIISPNIADIMGERAFNSYAINGIAISAEEMTANFDRVAAPALDKIADSADLTQINLEERGAILLFIALQINRGTGARNRTDDIMGKLKTQLESRFGSENLDPDMFPQDTEDQRKHFHVKLAVDSIKEISKALVDKDWLLMEAPQGSEFLLGDNPVSLHNSQPNDTWHSNMGLTCKGIEIYLPISPKYVLALMCPSLKASFAESVDSVSNTIKKLYSSRAISHPSLYDGINQAIQKASNLLDRGKTFLAAIDSGKPLVIKPDNVLHQNSLQVSHSERYIASKSGDFEVVKSMIESNPHWKAGIRWQVG